MLGKMSCNAQIFFQFLFCDIQSLANFPQNSKINSIYTRKTNPQKNSKFILSNKFTKQNIYMWNFESNIQYVAKSNGFWT